MKYDALVVGAGVGGLTTAAELAHAGQSVLVLEAHVYPGGCAGTFYHQGYRFDAGATLAGGFAPGAPLDWIATRYGIHWPMKPAAAVMQVHLSDGSVVTRWADPAAWQAERVRAFGVEAEHFWRWQEEQADRLWSLAMRGLPWPPQSPGDLLALAERGGGWLLEQIESMGMNAVADLGLDALRPVAARLGNASPRLREYVDGQLLIAAQATSEDVIGLYGAAALDLPRRGVGHLAGGMGVLAEGMVDAIQKMGGKVLYRHPVKRVRRDGSDWRVQIEGRRVEFSGRQLVMNLPPANAARLLEANTPATLLKRREIPPDGWGAFVVYAGVDGQVFSDTAALHQQILVGQPFSEGNSVFVSVSPAWDGSRAPAGQRALTISTHTRLASWWQLQGADLPAYEARRDSLQDTLLLAAERAFPGLRDGLQLALPGTPVTFARFTRREQGWVGGFPQTSLFRAWGPRLGRGLWLVGDSIFPGQSVPAVALGGVRIAQQVLAAAGGRPKEDWYDNHYLVDPA